MSTILYIPGIFTKLNEKTCSFITEIKKKTLTARRHIIASTVLPMIFRTGT